QYQTNHCFLAFSEYIAPQRIRYCPVFWPGFLFRAKVQAVALSHFRFMSVIRKSGSRFSGEIALQPLSEPEEQL
ncbi:MAG: hypothetical protein ACREFM_23935, partial [Hypericibacter sp.]